ncbi:MAG: FAD-dependent oxidoreductase [Desulfobacterales bacterium]|nr:FAD-dependent oxidoreductase [Desulfobacterales bacterium]
MKTQKNTLVIGAGISGLAAARRLFETGQKFTLITDRLGGRMHHSQDGSMNYGAIYLNDDYKNVLQFVGKGQRFKTSQVYAADGSQLKPLLHVSNLRFTFSILHLFLLTKRLQKELNRFRKEAQFIPQDKLLPKFPFIKKMAEFPASVFLKKYGLEKLDQSYSRFAFASTCFADVAEANMLFYLEVLFPVVIKTYIADFSDTYEKLTQGFHKNIIFDKVKNLTQTNEKLFTAVTSGGRRYIADNVIIAAPYHNAKCFYDHVPKPLSAKPATVTYVRGRRKNLYGRKKFILFNPKIDSICLIWQQLGDKDLILSIDPHPQLMKYYADYEILNQVTWKTAIVLSNSRWVPMRLKKNLFLAGDYNLCGLEDSYISGICAANQIIAEARV